MRERRTRPFIVRSAFFRASRTMNVHLPDGVKNTPPQTCLEFRRSGERPTGTVSYETLSHSL